VSISAAAVSFPAVAATASGPAVLSALEDGLRRAGIGFSTSVDATDPQEKLLQHRSYAATLGDRRWRIVAGTVRDRQGGQAMLSANPD
jgi:hypothetical protein